MPTGNALYPLWKKNLMDGGVDSFISNTTNLTPQCALVNITTGTPYVYSATHQFYNSSLTTGTPVVGTDQIITSCTTSVGSNDGIFDGGDLTFPSVSGAVVGALVIYRHTASTNATWRLMSYYDTVGGGLPVTPNSGNITITWNAAGIFQLSDADAKHDIRQVGAAGPLGVYEYRYREGPQDLQIGLLAQEVEGVVPTAMRQHGRYKYVNYHEALRCLKTHSVR